VPPSKPSWRQNQLTGRNTTPASPAPPTRDAPPSGGCVAGGDA